MPLSTKGRGGGVLMCSGDFKKGHLPTGVKERRRLGTVIQPPLQQGWLFLQPPFAKSWIQPW